MLGIVMCRNVENVQEPVDVNCATVMFSKEKDKSGFLRRKEKRRQNEYSHNFGDECCQ